jgi:hypothetical protein
MSSHNAKYYAEKKTAAKCWKIDILFKQQLISSQSDSHAKSEELITSHAESEEIRKDGDDEEYTAKVCNESSSDFNVGFPKMTLIFPIWMAPAPFPKCGVRALVTLVPSVCVFFPT